MPMPVIGSDSPPPWPEEIASTLGALVNTLGAADVAPTAVQLETLTRARATAQRVMTRWRAITTAELAAANAALKLAGLPPLRNG